jgi:signal transduction histidine kinase
LHPIQELPDLAELIAGVEGSGLGVDLKVAAVPASLPATIGHAGYRIVQEALTNVLRHSSARRAAVLVGVDGGSLVVEVADEGPPRSDDSPPGGQGLRGMAERAAALGGSCEAGPADGGGWRVRARLPLDGPLHGPLDGAAS